MLNIRTREQTNAWPGFVDLFSNLVIILIFLLIVFVFLWTTTSVFNTNTGAKKVAELEKAHQAQTEQIIQMTADSEQAEQLLIAARDALENQEATITNQQNLANAYEQQLAKLGAEQQKLSEQIANLTELLQQAIDEKAALAEQLDYMATTQQEVEEEEQQTLDEVFDQANSEIQTLTQRVIELEALLEQESEAAKQRDAEYIEMSNKLNKALADKIAELNSLSEYQSEFYKQVKNALGDDTAIKKDGDRFIVSSDIFFNSGSYQVSDAGKSQLRVLAKLIKNLETQIPEDIDWIIRVDGHTDKKAVLPGTVGYRNNMQLSLLRATAVIDELVKGGATRSRLIPSGFGELHPVAFGNDKASLQKNRRIELQLTNK